MLGNELHRPAGLAAHEHFDGRCGKRERIDEYRRIGMVREYGRLAAVRTAPRCAVSLARIARCNQDSLVCSRWDSYKLISDDATKKKLGEPLLVTPYVVYF
jgi:hypothetical protein